LVPQEVTSGSAESHLLRLCVRIGVSGLGKLEAGNLFFDQGDLGMNRLT
jgi:hypothetical protein